MTVYKNVNSPMLMMNILRMASSADAKDSVSFTVLFSAKVLFPTFSPRWQPRIIMKKAKG